MEVGSEMIGGLIFIVCVFTFTFLLITLAWEI